MVKIFQNYNLNQTITSYPGYSFQTIYSFRVSCLMMNTTYFVIDSQPSLSYSIIKFDQNWNFVGTLSLSSQSVPFYMTQQTFSILPFLIDNQIYYILTSYEVIYKFDSNMSLINHFIHEQMSYYSSYINTSHIL